MQQPTILDLPAEVLDTVFGAVSVEFPRDLRNAALVSRRFAHHASRILCKHIILNPNIERHIEALEQSTQLNSLRRLIFDGKIPAKNGDRLVAIISRIPEDTLMEFMNLSHRADYYDRANSCDELWSYLLLHQKNLRGLPVDINIDYLSNLARGNDIVLERLGSLQALDLYAENPDKDDLSALRLINKSPNLKSLTLEVPCGDEQTDMLALLSGGLLSLDNEDDYDVVESLFPGLEYLTIKYAYFNNKYNEPWIKALPFAQLKGIRMHAVQGTSWICDHMQTLLDEPRRWESLDIYGGAREQLEPAIDAMFHGEWRLRHFAFCLRETDYMEHEYLNSLIDTLETLSYHCVLWCEEDRPGIWSRDCMSIIPGYAVALKQLSCSIPHPVLGAEPSEEWTEWIQCLGQTPQLTTLCIANWPHPVRHEDITDAQYLDLLQEYTIRIFERVQDGYSFQLWTDIHKPAETDNSSSSDTDDEWEHWRHRDRIECSRLRYISFGSRNEAIGHNELQHIVFMRKGGEFNDQDPVEVVRIDPD
ncbi:Hypothetical protein D9617_4g003090 [Elsinoe fawcettii]|nr:Hypothetical protein D9617_4g003090 [Elsinoe fawcettii]